MQLTSLLALLPLLAVTSAAPACHRKEGSDLAVNRGGWGQEGGSRWRGQGQQSDVAKAAPSTSPVPQAQPDTQPAPVVEDTKDTYKVEPMPTTAPVPEPTTAPVVESVAAPPPAPTTEAQPETRPVVEDANLVAPSPISTPSPSPSPNVESPPAPSPVVAPPRTDPAPISRSTGAIGLAMNGESKANVASFGGKVGWYYSWNPAPLPGTEGLEFVPMIHRAVFAKEFSGVIPEGTTHMLSFNEPDISGDHGGANMSPAEAAEMHKLWTGQVPASVKIGSPAVARGGQKWMDDWLSQCAGGCRYDFVPYHYYGTDANGLIQYTKDFYAHFKKPLWLTEFACHDYGTGRVCTKSEVSDFMTTFFTWADSAEGKGMLERWSWFGAFPNHAATNANGILNPDGTANEMGKLYASF